MHQDGPDRRGLDIALLYQTDRVQVIESQWRQGCTTLVDGLGPDGNLDMDNPQNSITCDSDGDGLLDGNRLSSRPPLVVHLRICQSACVSSMPVDDPEIVELWMIVNHMKSKTEDSTSVQYTVPRRVQEAEFVADLVDEIITAEPAASLVVAGDLNDYPASQPLSIMSGKGLHNLSEHFSWEDRYTYNFHGVSQWLDYVLVRPSLSLAPVEARMVHINADYPYSYQGEDESLHRSSDHDLLVIELAMTNNWTYLPLLIR